MLIIDTSFSYSNYNTLLLFFFFVQCSLNTVFFSFTRRAGWWVSNMVTEKTFLAHTISWCSRPVPPPYIDFRLKIKCINSQVFHALGTSPHDASGNSTTSDFFELKTKRVNLHQCAVKEKPQAPGHSAPEQWIITPLSHTSHGFWKMTNKTK